MLVGRDFPGVYMLVDSSSMVDKEQTAHEIREIHQESSAVRIVICQDPVVDKINAKCIGYVDDYSLR